MPCPTPAPRARRVRACLAGALLVVLSPLPGCGSEPTASDPALELRVVSLAPSITRIVDALGARAALVAADDYSRRLPEFRELPSVGGLFSPDLERTLELRPRLVLAVRSAEQGGYVSQLRARGIRVEELGGHTLTEVLASFERIGALLGREREGRALVKRVEAELAAVRSQTGSLARRSVVLVLERDPLYVVGGGSFTQTLIEAAGGRNIFADLSAPYPRVGLEALAERAPEVIIDATVDPEAGPEAVERTRAWWRRFGWVRRVEAMQPGVATLPGPELAAGARVLRGLIHPPAQAATAASAPPAAGR